MADIKYNFSMVIFLLGIGFSGIGCNGIYEVFFGDNSETEIENDGIKVENESLKVSLDSLSESYELLFRDFTAIKNKRRDTVFVFNPVDSINWIDSVRYVFRDSVVVSYDDRTFPEDSIIKYLNLFFRTDEVSDTAGLHFNFEVFDGAKLSYLRDSLYQVPDSITGWRIDWWRE